MHEFLQSICDWLKLNLNLLPASTTPGTITLWVELFGYQQAQLYLHDRDRRLLLGTLPARVYGVLPMGQYAIAEIRLTGSGTDYPDTIYGSEGIIVLASGQNNWVIQGGDRPSAQGDWRGGIRLRDEDMRSLIIALESINEPVICQIIEPARSRSEWQNDDDTDYQDTYTETNNSWNEDSGWSEPATTDYAIQDALIEDARSELESPEPEPSGSISWQEDGYC
jgi:hypothetical protein